MAADAPGQALGSEGVPVIDLTALVQNLAATEERLRTQAATLRLWARTFNGGVLLLRNAAHDSIEAADDVAALRRVLDGRG